MTKRLLLIPALVYVVLSGCASVDQDIATPADDKPTIAIPERAAARTPAIPTDSRNNAAARQLQNDASSATLALAPQTGQTTSTPESLNIESARRTGTVESRALDEISGLAVSRKTPGVLFAVNDSGNPAQLHALSETGASLGQWTVKARNRDWEDMGNLRMNGKDYLIIGDTGDNRQSHKESTLYLVEEPSLDTPSTTILIPFKTLRFRYEDGPRNVEAFAYNGNTLYLISKEPLGPDGPNPSHLYELQIPEHIDSSLLVARHTGNLPLAPTNLESRLAAAVAGVDLNHPTALEFDSASNTAYVLTYRHVIRIVKSEQQSWAQAFSQSSERIYAHDLKQAEALTVMPGKSVWFTSEYLAAPLWALPDGTVMNNVIIIPASAEHLDGIVALLPRLADFDVPAHRVPTDLWHGDADLLRAWARDQRSDVSVCIAVDEAGSVLGVAAASEREDLLSHAPSAHLEVLSVAGHAERQGLGHRLLESIEQTMREKGATGMSLHVFGNNHRARALYAREGFDEEIVRCFKPFE